MTRTVKVPISYLADYLEGFTRRFLDMTRPRSVDVEVLEFETGDQHPIENARLLGIAYDGKNDAVEIALDSGDHRVNRPVGVWAIEEMDGFVSVLRIESLDGHQEILSVKRIGILPLG